ncbi:MAG TPA: DUF2510 domain-containing protein [Thermoleophilaceae bacterium]|jgi:hypothetical protein
MTDAPPNWYPDPSGAAQLRYWDGRQWTEYTQGGPAVAPGQQPAPPPSAAPTAAGAVPGAGPAPGGGSTGGSKLPLIIGGALVAVALVVVLVLVLAGGGGEEGGGEEAKVEETIEQVATSKDPAVCEERHTVSYLQKATGLAGGAAVQLCEESTPENDVTGVEISDVEVSDTSAEAKAQIEGGDYSGETLEISLEKQGDDWKVDDLDRPKVASGAAAEKAVQTTVLNFGSAEGIAACDYLSYPGLERLGGRSGCEKSFKEGQPANYTIQSVTVSGTSATTVVEEARQGKTIEFKLSRELGEWEIDSFAQR